MANPETNVDLWLNIDDIPDWDAGIQSLTVTAASSQAQTTDSVMVGPIMATAASSQAQTTDSVMVGPIMATAASAQGQTSAATGTESFTASVSAAQGQTTAGTGNQTFAATAASAQGSQTAAASAAMAFVATAAPSQGQSSAANGAESFFATVTAGQGQSTAATGTEAFTASASGSQAQTSTGTDIEAFVGTGASRQAQTSASSANTILRPWPLSQRLQVAGYSDKSPTGLIVSPMHTGNINARARTLKGVRPISGDITITAADKTTLDSFYSSTTAYGALPFTWVDPIGGAQSRFRFTSAPLISALAGTTFSAKLSLEIIP